MDTVTKLKALEAELEWVEFQRKDLDKEVEQLKSMIYELEQIADHHTDSLIGVVTNSPISISN